MIKIDKRLLIHDFLYSEYIGIDRNHKPKYSNVQRVTNCRIDYGVNYSRNETESTKMTECIIFCYSAHTTPFLAFKEKSKISFNNQEYTIKKVVPIFKPYNNTLFAYELEIV